MAVASVNACRVAAGQERLTLPQLVEQGILSYIDFPEALKGKYQSFTQADIGALRNAGFDAPMLDVEQGVAHYVESLISPERAPS